MKELQLKETAKETAIVGSEPVTAKPAWHAPVLEEVDYIKTQNGPVVVYNIADGATFYTA